MSSVLKVLRTTITSSIALAALLVLGLAPSASAGFKMRFDDLGTGAIDRTYTDADLDGIVAITPAPPQSAGTFTLTNGVGLSKPFKGSAAVPDMDLQAGVRRGAGTRTMKVYLTDTGFNGIGQAFMSIGGTTRSATITYETYWSPSNAEFALTNLIGSQTFVIGSTTGGFSGDKVSLGAIGNAVGYSLTQVVTIAYTGGGDHLTTFNAALNVPEPATLGLFGAGLLGALAVRRRRQAAKTA